MCVSLCLDSDILEAWHLPTEGGDPDAMKHNIEFHQKQLQNSVSIVRMNLTKLQRTLMGALIVLDVHGITAPPLQIGRPERPGWSRRGGRGVVLRG